MSGGPFPKSLEQGIVKLLLKKRGTDVNELKHYRPVCNLAFVSKLMEKAVDVQITEFLKRPNLLPVHLSSYRQKHSVEPALLHIHGEIMAAFDKNKVCVLALLDQSSAFDLVKHDILLDVLRYQFNFADVVLDWFASYLSGRSTCVFVYGANGALGRSGLKPSTTGVRQGSILGPKLFNCYVSSLTTILDKCDVTNHFYADDIQLLVS